jgi:serine/threonine protein kinase
VAGINLDWNKLLVADDGHTMINIDQIFYPCAVRGPLPFGASRIARSSALRKQCYQNPTRGGGETKNARPYYISPELMPGTTIDVEGECSSVNRTHIWAVGLIAIQLATGALPMEYTHDTHDTRHDMRLPY